MFFLVGRGEVFRGGVGCFSGGKLKEGGRIACVWGVEGDHGVVCPYVIAEVRKVVLKVGPEGIGSLIRGELFDFKAS